MKRNTALTSTFTNGFDSDGTLTAQSLSKAHREPLRGVARGVLVAIGIALCIVPNAGSSESVQQKNYVDYKTYSLYLLDFNYKQYNCLDALYTHESNWNPEASNGSHYGIPQGNSEWLKNQDGWTQLVWGLNYIGNRYGEPCVALDHWSKYGWH
ncbi:MAG: hypothetical protein EBR60_08045 [Burkholderiaceae bacterium]|nr:hypothetical protein [Burkholderiaceae bacterium]